METTVILKLVLTIHVPFTLLIPHFSFFFSPNFLALSLANAKTTDLCCAYFIGPSSIGLQNKILM